MRLNILECFSTAAWGEASLGGDYFLGFLGFFGLEDSFLGHDGCSADVAC